MSVKTLNNRADLLRWYQYQALEASNVSTENPVTDNKTDWHKATEILGYKYLEPLIDQVSEGSNVKDAHKQGETTKPDESPDIEATSPSPSQDYYYLSHREVYEFGEPDPLPKAFKGYTELTKAELAPLEKGKPFNHQPISNPYRLSPFIEKNLRQQRGKKTDIARLIRLISQKKPLLSLPTKAKTLPVGRVTVLIDLCDRLTPFWVDSQQLCQIIQQKQGKFGQDIRILNENKVTGDYYTYDDFIKKQNNPKQWQTIPAQNAVFIIGDAGQLSAKDSDTRKQWLALLNRLKKRGIKPIIIAPIAPEQQCSLVQALSHQVLWYRHSCYRPEKRIFDKKNHQQKVTRIIAFLSLSPHIELELFRAIIEAVLGAETSGIEAAVFLHVDIQWGYETINVKLECRKHYQHQLKSETAEIQKQILTLIKRQHIGQFPAIWYETILDAEHIVNFPLDEIANIEKAKEFMKRLVLTGAKNRSHEGLNNYFIRHLGRSSQAQIKANKDISSAEYALALHQLGEPIPEEYDQSVVLKITSHIAEAQQWLVLQTGEDVYIYHEESYQTEKSKKGIRYGKILASFNTPYDSINIGRQQRPLDKDQPLLLSFSEQHKQPLKLDTGREKLTLSTLNKPSWATSLSQLQTKLIARLYFAGQTHEMILPVNENKTVRDSAINWECLDDDNPKEINSKQDINSSTVSFDDFGISTCLTVKGISQTFRWIEAGSFLMGSAETEKGRYDDETQHQVTLSQGFWLADTTITQAFWKAVMGENPSHFKAPQNPVEQVSWDDCQLFIKKLKEQFNQLDCRLPTEAQWEYACRAGTQTAFNFKGRLDLKKVNYSGIFGSSGYDDKALQRTAPVKSYPANAWGLYEMHGNVWEWCQDYYQHDLGSNAVIDPEGATAGSKRVLRGGGWGDFGGYVRSAIRDYYSPDSRNDRIGLRLLIGQSSRALQNQSFKASSESGRTGSSVKQETVSTDSELVTELKKLVNKINPFK